MVDLNDVGYEITLWEAVKGKSCPEIDGNILCNSLDVLADFYAGGIVGSNFGSPKIWICNNLKTYLVENEDLNKEDFGVGFVEYRFQPEGLQRRAVSKLELSEIYTQIKYDLVDKFSVSDLEKKILPTFSRSNDF